MSWKYDKQKFGLGESKLLRCLLVCPSSVLQSMVLNFRFSQLSNYENRLHVNYFNITNPSLNYLVKSWRLSYILVNDHKIAHFRGYEGSESSGLNSSGVIVPNGTKYSVTTYSKGNISQRL